VEADAGGNRRHEEIDDELVSGDDRTPALVALEHAVARRAEDGQRDVADEEARQRVDDALLETGVGAGVRRRSERATSTGPRRRMRADFDAVATTPPVSPICAPTATALARSLTARPLQRPAAFSSRPTTWPRGRKVNIATTEKRKTTAMATPCSSRWAPVTGATAFTAEAPQIIVPPARRSASGRRMPSMTPRI
jgi:hypothetical protein